MTDYGRQNTVPRVGYPIQLTRTYLLVEVEVENFKRLSRGHGELAFIQTLVVEESVYCLPGSFSCLVRHQTNEFCQEKLI